MDLQRLQSNLSKLDIVDLTVEILDEMEVFIADLNRSQLADEGVNDEGANLGDYSGVTVWIKEMYGRGTGSITDHVTLYDTGALHKSIFSSTDGKVLTLDSKDSKVDELEIKYGNFLGLTKDSQSKVKEEFLKRFEIKFYGSILQ